MSEKQTKYIFVIGGVVSSLRIYFVVFILSLIFSCKNHSAGNEIVIEREKSLTTKIENQNSTVNALADKKTEKDFAYLVTEKNSPVRIIDAVSNNGRMDFKKGAKIEVQNISDKSISSVSLGFAPPEECIEFMMVGDLIINNDETTKINEIKSGDKFLMNVSADDSESYLSSLTFKNCPRKHHKPSIYVWGVQFTNGENWKATFWDNNRSEQR